MTDKKETQELIKLYEQEIEDLKAQIKDKDTEIEDLKARAGAVASDDTCEDYFSEKSLYNLENKKTKAAFTINGKAFEGYVGNETGVIARLKDGEKKVSFKDFDVKVISVKKTTVAKAQKGKTEEDEFLK
jgi:hypothetical protein